MSEARKSSGVPIPAEVIPRLTVIAAELAAKHAEPRPAAAAAVATTRNTALEVLGRYGPETIPGEPGAAPAYAVVMTGRFESYRGGGPGRRRPGRLPSRSPGVSADGKVVESDGKTENARRVLALDPCTPAALRSHVEM